MASASSGPPPGRLSGRASQPAVGFERDWGIGKIQAAPESRHIAIVGGGPAGLKAAEVAAQRGHQVTLFEASGQLGGQVLVAAAAMPYRDEFGCYLAELRIYSFSAPAAKPTRDDNHETWIRILAFNHG